MRMFSVGDSRQRFLDWTARTSITTHDPHCGCIQHAILDGATRVTRVAYCASTLEFSSAVLEGMVHDRCHHAHLNSVTTTPENARVDIFLQPSPSTAIIAAYLQTPAPQLLQRPSVLLRSPGFSHGSHTLNRGVVDADATLLQLCHRNNSCARFEIARCDGAPDR